MTGTTTYTCSNCMASSPIKSQMDKHIQDRKCLPHDETQLDRIEEKLDRLLEENTIRKTIDMYWNKKKADEISEEIEKLLKE